MAGRVTAKDYNGREITKDEWIQMEIVLSGNMPSVRRSRRDPASTVYDDVLFKRGEVLWEFSPEEPSEDQDVAPPRREPSSPPSEFVMIDLPKRNANWTAPTKFEVVTFPLTTPSTTPEPFSAKADASVQPATTANGRPQESDGTAAQPGASTSDTGIPLGDYWISKGGSWPPPNPPEKSREKESPAYLAAAEADHRAWREICTEAAAAKSLSRRRR